MVNTALTGAPYDIDGGHARLLEGHFGSSRLVVGELLPDLLHVALHDLAQLVADRVGAELSLGSRDHAFGRVVVIRDPPGKGDLHQHALPERLWKARSSCDSSSP